MKIFLIKKYKKLRRNRPFLLMEWNCYPTTSTKNSILTQIWTQLLYFYYQLFFHKQQLVVINHPHPFENYIWWNESHRNSPSGLQWKSELEHKVKTYLNKRFNYDYTR